MLGSKRSRHSLAYGVPAYVRGERPHYLSQKTADQRPYDEGLDHHDEGLDHREYE